MARSDLQDLQLDPRDEAFLVAATERRAAEDVELACEFLRQAGLLPAEPNRAKAPCRSEAISLSLMLNAASFMRLRQWARAGQLDIAGADLPEPEALLGDMRRQGPDQLIDAAALTRKVFRTWLARMGWAPAPAPRCDVLVDQVRPELVVEALAQLLWQCRDLPDSHGKEETK